jgi:hypothetical protein
MKDRLIMTIISLRKQFIQAGIREPWNLDIRTGILKKDVSKPRSSVVRSGGARKDPQCDFIGFS